MNHEQKKVFAGAMLAMLALIGLGWLMGKNNVKLKDVTDVLACVAQLATVFIAYLALNTWREQAKHSFIESALNNLILIESQMKSYSNIIKYITTIKETCGPSKEWNRHIYSYENNSIRFKELINEQIGIENKMRTYLKEEQYQELKKKTDKIKSNLLLINLYLQKNHPDLYKVKPEKDPNMKISGDIDKLNKEIQFTLQHYRAYLSQI
ncbi:hypothetical protein [Vibrio parahaemolyticus]|uniref:hypothetical protein n=1 Tax=Vibrio parahaemolyticus TaxID=670 RepID=UPI0031FEED4E